MPVREASVGYEAHRRPGQGGRHASPLQSQQVGVPLSVRAQTGKPLGMTALVQEKILAPAPCPETQPVEENSAVGKCCLHLAQTLEEPVNGAGTLLHL